MLEFLNIGRKDLKGVQKEIVKVKSIRQSVLVISICIAFLSLNFALPVIQSQAVPLSLAKVLTGLQSKSGNFTLAQKNEFIRKKVQQNGITFRLTPEIESELKIAGASPALITAIRAKSPRTRPTPRPSIIPDDEKQYADFESLTVDQNITEDGLKGIRINANFNVYNMKGVESDIVFRFDQNGEFLKSSNKDFSTVAGDLSVRRLLKPDYSATVYDESVFIPYEEFNLPAGTHNLKIDADVILRDGTQVTHLTLQDLKLVIPSAAPTPTIKKGEVIFDKIWVDYNVNQNDKLGMVVHIKVTVNGLKGEEVYTQLLFEKQDGTALTSSNKTYRNQSGQTAAYRKLNTTYDSNLFNDVDIFIPYEEFNLPVGDYNLRIHADLIDKNFGDLGHMTYHNFTYSRNK